MTKHSILNLKHLALKTHKHPRKKIMFKTIDYLVLILFLIVFFRQLIG